MMSIGRREFLRIAGTCAVLGLPGIPTPPASAQPSTRFVAASGVRQAKQWAMVVDLDKLTEADRIICVETCHRIHNVPQIDNPRHEIKWIWVESFEHVFEEQANEFIPSNLLKRPVLVLCNHCGNPPCTRVCPTQATWRREDGIVMMDWHRCIGCRYCMVACPYGSRSFNWQDPRPFIGKANQDFPTRTKGVVGKCTFCAERLDQGLRPACVESCPSGALVFGDLQDEHSEVRQLLASRFSIRRRPGLGTQPEVYYLI